VRWERGRASERSCWRCLENDVVTPASDWAQVHGTDGLDVLADYMPLCRRCHNNYDGTIPKKLGMQNTRAKFADDDIRAIRARHGSGESLAQLAREYGVSGTCIGKITCRRTWSHIR